LPGGSAPEYGIVVERDVMVPMRDGIRLATDIYKPAEDGEPLRGPLPTILGRTSYDKTWRRLWVEPVANYFAPRGYVVVLQDLRGRHGSEGTGQYFHTANVHEGEDGYDAIEWVAAQPWSNGRVGMVGSSHGGIVQTVASLTRPPHLTAIWVDVAPTNVFAHEAREGGAMCLWMFAALFLHAHDAQETRDDPAGRRMIMEGWQNIRELVQSMPFRPGDTPLRAVPNLEKTLFDYYYRGEYDEFWAMKACDQEPHFRKAADIPGVFSGGWYDPFAVAMTGQYAAMAEQNGSPQRLDMGPWNHGGRRSGQTYAGDVDFGPEAAYGTEVYGGQRLRWFDRWLKEVPNGVEDDPPVRLFVMGGGDGGRNRDGRLSHGGRWREEREWPLARTEYVKYHLRDGGGLATEHPGQSAPPVSYTYDPRHPVPTVSATGAPSELLPLPEGFDSTADDPRAYMNAIFEEGGAHQKESPGLVGARAPYPLLADRPDVLVFQTEPLEQDMEVTGAIDVSLWVSSSAVDTDFTAKVLDVYPPSEDYPDGYHLNLADSIIRARYRNGFDSAEMMEPGEVYSVRIALPPICNLFKAGHLIRLDVSSSNFPRFDVNPNTGEPIGRHTHMIEARNIVYLDGARPSHVVLPVVPLR
jgi:putative CocE/NonD family hydrolase